jgi:hypothetical protein
MLRAKPTRTGRWEIDSTVMRAHQHAAMPGAPRRRIWSPIRPWRSSATPRRPQGAPSNDKDRATDSDREALGRSRGGLSTKIHLAADDRCRPIARVITAGQRHDAVAFPPLMNTIRIRGRGRPRTRPGRLRADKAYSSRSIRTHLRRRRIRATIVNRTWPAAGELSRQGGSKERTLIQSIRSGSWLRTAGPYERNVCRMCRCRGT